MQVAVVTPESGGFPRHSHDDEYVISVNVHGWEKVRLDRASFEAGVEEVTFYNPGQVQSSTTQTADTRPWSCVSLYVPVADMLALTGGEPVEFARPVLSAPDLRHRILAIAAGAPADLDAILVDVLRRGAGGSRPGGPAPGDVRIAHVLRRLREDLSAAVSVTDVATEVGLSREQLIRSFSRAVGCSPYAWHLQARLAHGRRLLREGVPIAHAAASAGFADQAHFHKHFRAAYAMTPGRFRRVSTSDKTR
ncbi:AraC family transcriptional regulator [Micromonospora sp. ATCC 39149]|uniref:Helix-turn-helix transcriptional regulator n=1 Tax=Micromonospora carbonacea TaxID=47853 RepID=A0A7D6CBF6_9ACTN|nr:AraC family transcriptional regulator [Micromonospora sp. ATCC 39149]QLK00563.1 helix-turn-helix transcriptional regulator [Micromonospora carbonacea]